MHYLSLQLLIALSLILQPIAGLVTLQTIRNLTTLTDECKDMIVDSGGVVVDELARVLGGGQVVLNSGEEEVEDAVAAALRMLCSDLLIELEKPLSSSTPHLPEKQCQVVKKEYHEFLASTVQFLHEVQERQMLWHWGPSSPVFNAVVWMQGLWASRRANNQNRSFIEQQMGLYSATGCFGKSQEVLRRDVELVEYMNDLIDTFN
ncbi:hypothetical protein F5882DRAFT_406357 [Hyaloscypha sp. PMI_1271]|nr:hypothetical protein F5882DRAFT_406357 [Hyaloscypha sp. PMI_1271]